MAEMEAISIRALESSEWEAFRDLRLKALKASAGVFAVSYETAIVRTPEEWQDTVKGDTHQVFGLFDEERLIGITGVFAWWDDPSGETAILVMSYIVPEFRGKSRSPRSSLISLTRHPSRRRHLHPS